MVFVTLNSSISLFVYLMINFGFLNTILQLAASNTLFGI